MLPGGKRVCIKCSEYDSEEKKSRDLIDFLEDKFEIWLKLYRNLNRYKLVKKAIFSESNGLNKSVLNLKMEQNENYAHYGEDGDKFTESDIYSISFEKAKKAFE